ncbi:MAG: universal stress protein [Pseudomonadota bacterium]
MSNILVPIDVEFEASWRLALPEAMAAAKRSGSEIHLLSVLPDFGMSLVGQYFPPDFKVETDKFAREALDKIAAEMLGDAVKWSSHAAHGGVVETILHFVDDLSAQLVVMAAHPPSIMHDLLAGSHADRVAARASCSVLVVRG